MNEFHHAIVWIDHQQARVLRFGPQGVDLEIVLSSHRHEHLHHKAKLEAFARKYFHADERMRLQVGMRQ